MNERRPPCWHLSLLGASSLLCLLATASPVPAQQGEFQQVAKLLASDGAAKDQFGWDVAIDGDFAIVSSPWDDDLGDSSGAAYIFERGAGGTVRNEVAKLTAPNGTPEDFFGWRVAISGDTALVGAPRSGFDTPGSAFVFERDPDTDEWHFVTELTEGEPGDDFGSSVALQGDTAVVGAASTDGPDFSDGAVFVYQRDAGGPGAWGRVAKLTPALACGEPATACGWWGDSSFPSSQGLDVDGDLILGSVGGSGRHYAYVFHRARVEPEAWRRVARTYRPEDSNEFGNASAAEGATLIVGDFNNNELGVASGAAYIFERDPGGPLPWVEVAKLTAPDGERDDWFGRSVEMSGDLAVVGAPQETLPEAAGYAWVFERDAGGPGQWGAIAKLTAADGKGGDDFGVSVAISGETVIVGATDEETFGLRSGAAYVFERTTSRRGADPLMTPSADVEVEELLDSEVADRPLPPRTGGDRTLAPAGGVRATRLDGGGPVCFELFAPGIPYDDDLELSVSGSEVTGWWRNALDDGTDFPLSGVLQPGRALVRCDAGVDPCPFGTTYGFLIDLPLDGTLDLVRHENGLWNAWIDEIRYETVEGLCP